jgi:hypothetical protein
VKRRIAAVAVALMAFPAAASAAPDLRGSGDVPSSSLGVPPHLAVPDRPSPEHVPQYLPDQGSTSPKHLPAQGTDVAAPDQQASKRGPVPAFESDPASGDFDWGDAGICAATALALMGVSLAGGMTLRRRQHRPAA